MTGIETRLREKLDALAAVPLYAQLFGGIKEMIRTGELAAGDLLPSEPLLCDTLKISRSTVRQAFALLEADGYIVRRRGKGTFVSKPKLRRRLSRLCSFSKQMSELGMQSQSTVLSFDVVKGDDEDGLQGMPGEIYRIERLRETESAPFMIDTVYVPAGNAPALTAEALTGSLYDIIEQRSGKTPQSAVETYEVVRLSKAQMKMLQMDSETAFLVTRTSKTAAGELFEVAKMLIRGDRCRLEATLESGAVAFARTLA